MARDRGAPDLEDLLPSTLGRAAAEVLEPPEYAMEVLRRWASQCSVEAEEFEPNTVHVIVPYGDRPLHGVAHFTTAPLQLVFYVLYDGKVTDALRPAYADLLLHANHDLPLGTFEMNPRGGPIRFRSSLMLEGLELSPRLFAAVIEPALRLFVHYLPALDDVCRGVPPDDAVAAVRRAVG